MGGCGLGFTVGFNPNLGSISSSRRPLGLLGMRDKNLDSN